MNQDYKNCLDKKRLYRSYDAKPLAAKELKAAADDLEDARFSLSKKKHKWATIQAYYSMFHARGHCSTPRDIRKEAISVS